MLAFGNRHFAPEGGGGARVVDAETGAIAEPMLVDRRYRQGAGRSRTSGSFAASSAAERRSPRRRRKAPACSRSRRRRGAPPRCARMSSLAVGMPRVPAAAPPAAPPAAAAEAMSPRTRRLLQGAIVPTLLRMAWPNILVMLAQASTGLIETWWVSQLGTDALAGMALVFPGFMMMQMLSAGAIGGGISSAIARALGAGRRDDADALVLHALIDQRRRSASSLSAAVPGLRAGRSIAAHGRRGRLARGGAALFERRLRRQRAGLADERAGQRDPRHRQHAGAVARGLPRRRAAGAAVAAA